MAERHAWFRQFSAADPRHLLDQGFAYPAQMVMQMLFGKLIDQDTGITQGAPRSPILDASNRPGGRNLFKYLTAATRAAA